MRNEGEDTEMIEETIQAILNKYRDDDFSVWLCGDHRPGEDEIFAFEGEYGISLPEEFREFCMSYYGVFYIEAKEEVWPQAELYTVAPHWTFLYGFYVYGFSDQVSEFHDIRVQTKLFREETGQDLVPLLKVICDPNPYCMDADGNIYRWDLELEPVDMSFLELFECKMRKLREWKDEMKKNGGNK